MPVLEAEGRPKPTELEHSETDRWEREKREEKVGEHIMMQILGFTLSPMPLRGFK